MNATETTTYLATIPTQHESRHHSELAAIDALLAAERRTGLVGRVVMRVQSGTHRSETVVYPLFGPTATE